MEGSQKIGSIGETRFVLECLNRGITVLTPAGVHGFDFVVDVNGKYTKVQVKTTSVVDSNRSYKWDIRSKSDKSEVYAFYVQNTDLFFLVPAEVVVAKKSTFKISLRKIHGEYLHNWEIFK